MPSIWDQKAELTDNLISLNRELERLSSGLEHNNALLSEHMRRTALLEEKMELALLPIRVGKVLGIILGAAATAATTWITMKSL